MAAFQWEPLALKRGCKLAKMPQREENSICQVFPLLLLKLIRWLCVCKGVILCYFFLLIEVQIPIYRNKHRLSPCI